MIKIYEESPCFVEDLSPEAQQRAFVDLFHNQNQKTPHFEDFLSSCEEDHLLFNIDGSEYKGKWRW